MKRLYGGGDLIVDRIHPGSRNPVETFHRNVSTPSGKPTIRSCSSAIAEPLQTFHRNVSTGGNLIVDRVQTNLV